MNLVGAADVPDRPEPPDDLTGAGSEARVIVNGEPVEGVDPLFVGSLDGAIEFVHGLTAGQQRDVSIFTEGRMYDPTEV